MSYQPPVGRLKENSIKRLKPYPEEENSQKTAIKKLLRFVLFTKFSLFPIANTTDTHS